MTNVDEGLVLLDAWMAQDSYFEDLAVFGLGPLHPGGLHASRELLSSRDWSDSSVLDIGCGNGTTARMIGALGGRVTCVEPSRLMREAARQQGIPKDSIVNSTMESLVLGPGQFDAIIIEGVIGFVEDPISHIARLLRSLRPGGDLFICDWMAHDRRSVPSYGFEIHGEFEPEATVVWLNELGASCKLSQEAVVARAFTIDISEAHRRAEAFFFGEVLTKEFRAAVERKAHLLRSVLQAPVRTVRFILRATLPSK